MKKTIMTQTFTPTYDISEDRIRLAINYEDYENRIDLMITRRFALQFIPALEEWVEGGAVQKKSVDENSDGNNEVVHQTDGVNLELFKGEAILLEEVNMKKDAQNNTILNLQCKSATVVAILNTRMLQEFSRVLKKSMPKIEWGIGYNF